MAKFRKRPVEIEAVRVKEAIKAVVKDWSALPWWLANAYDDGKIVFIGESIFIKTLEGEMQAKVDDWIIRGIAGELYPCKGEIFEATYDPVHEDETEFVAELDHESKEVDD